MKIKGKGKYTYFLTLSRNIISFGVIITAIFNALMHLFSIEKSDLQ